VDAKGLVDTGALLALLDRDDKWHAACRRAIDGLRLPLATSAAVLAELFHLVGDHPDERRAAWALVRSGAFTVLPVGDADLPRLDALMERYADRPMDLADATLVHLAERETLSTVFTVDHADFERYRIGGRRKFRVVPASVGR
jgi:hypothetical protein